MTVQGFKYHTCCYCILSKFESDKKTQKQNKTQSVADCYALMSRNKGLCHGYGSTGWEVNDAF